ncbi:transcriptional regulator, AraC family [Sphingobium sp. AP50]|uniref:AraC family transcriptional regulator n=1 Tax=Sphingobium sp. AP50 TaxID=1884369 RepID=UPI0008C1435E|nr:AraC family transcriptional regulator [Sphingobium sp. AP50]SEJ91380.1 transcriptional regulator, AraC family [Sphingobium sp. AP50]
MQDPQYERVVADDGSSFRCVHRICDDLSTQHPWHFHPQFELSWVMRSRGTRYVGDCIQPYVPNEVVLYGPDLPHCSRNDTAGPDGIGAEHITVQFDLQCLGEGFLEIPEAADIKSLIEDARMAVIFAPAAHDLVGDHMRRLLALSGMARLLKLAEILEALTHLPRTKLITPEYRRNVVVDQRLIERLNQVQHYIDTRFRGVVSQAEIAQKIGMTAVAFSKFIRANTGRTFGSMVKLARITEACRLLVHTDATITNVGLDCGYQHSSHFDRHFMEMKGLSPTEYRRKMRTLGHIGAREADDWASRFAA